MPQYMHAYIHWVQGTYLSTYLRWSVPAQNLEACIVPVTKRDDKFSSDINQLLTSPRLSIILKKLSDRPHPLLVLPNLQPPDF